MVGTAPGLTDHDVEEGFVALFVRHVLSKARGAHHAPQTVDGRAAAQTPVIYHDHSNVQ